jgi:hypothetical protein
MPALDCQVRNRPAVWKGRRIAAFRKDLPVLGFEARFLLFRMTRGTTAPFLQEVCAEKRYL